MYRKISLRFWTWSTLARVSSGVSSSWSVAGAFAVAAASLIFFLTTLWLENGANESNVNEKWFNVHSLAGSFEINQKLVRWIRYVVFAELSTANVTLWFVFALTVSLQLLNYPEITANVRWWNQWSNRGRSRCTTIELIILVDRSMRFVMNSLHFEVITGTEYRRLLWNTVSFIAVVCISIIFDNKQFF